MLERLGVFLARRSWRFYQSCSFTATTHYRNAGFRVPIMNGAGLELLTSREAWLRPLVEAAYRIRSGEFLDIGANIGQALLIVASVDRAIPYTAFEPNLAACFYLERFIRENDLRNHRVVPVGLGERDRSARLQLDNPFDVSASVVSGFRPDSHYSAAKRVLVRRGDDVLARLEVEDIAFMKIDVEGHEPGVVRGLERTLQEEKPWCVVEVLAFEGIEKGRLFPELSPAARRELVESRKRNIEELDRLVGNLGYERFLVLGEGRVVAVPGLVPERAIGESNFLLVPRGEVEAFRSVAGSPAIELSILSRP